MGTPIGNLEDITFRAVRILQTVDLIAAEDTRQTSKLLNHFQIATPQVSYHQHSRFSRRDYLIDELKQGKNIALVTDAGMPCISDPGYELVKGCIEVQIPVMPIPGVTAVITALSVSGLPTERFIFEGFLPTKRKEREARLTVLQSERRTMVFYEAPHRLIETLTDLNRFFPECREIVITRELTKIYEAVWRGSLKEAIAFYDKNSPKGEFTLVLGGKTGEDTLILSETEIKAELIQLLNQGMSRSQASQHLASLTSLSRRQIYQLTLEL